MAFSLVNPSGWTNGDLLTETQINQLDADHAKAIDGTGGGTYTLTAPLNIAGAEVDIEVLDTTYLDVGADATIQNLIVPGQVSGNLDVDGDVSCDELGAARVASDSVHVNDYLRLRAGTGWDGLHTMLVGQDPQLIIVTILSGAVTWTISNTGAGNGDFFWVKNEDTTFNVVINSPSASPLVTITPSKAALLWRSSDIWRAMLISST